jgi:hypothetical protein
LTQIILLKSENNTTMKYVKGILTFVGCLAILLIVGLGIRYNWKHITDLVLGITAVIILWYTWETSQIRKAEEMIAEASYEASKRNKMPSVGCIIFTNPERTYDTRFRVVNQSFYPVAVRVRCNFKINDELLDKFSSDYDGTRYWNLQINEEKEGHFSWLDLHENKGLIPNSEVKKVKEATSKEEAEETINKYISFNLDFKLPKLTMDLELYCKNNFGFETSYPTVRYRFDYDKKEWIPTLTSDKPYWEFESKPSWV